MSLRRPFKKYRNRFSLNHFLEYQVTPNTESNGYILLQSSTGISVLGTFLLTDHTLDSDLHLQPHSEYSSSHKDQASFVVPFFKRCCHLPQCPAKTYDTVISWYGFKFSNKPWNYLCTVCEAPLANGFDKTMWMQLDAVGIEEADSGIHTTRYCNASCMSKDFILCSFSPQRAKRTVACLMRMQQNVCSLQQSKSSH